jgi:hypothetical protein
VHTYAAGLVLAGGRMFEDGARLARGFGVVGVVLVGSGALISTFGRGDRTTAAYGVPVLFWRVVGGICLGLAFAGLVMMALGSSGNGQL